MKKICGIATLPRTIQSFMLGNLEYVSDHGFESYCMSSPGEIDSQKVKYISIPQMKWGVMGPLELFRCIRALYKVFKKEQFDIIQYATSNAALCASIAGWLARVPVRINLQWGIAYPVFKGWKRWLFYYSTLLICKLSTSVQPDSKGNLRFSIEHRLYPAKKGAVVYNGSACGIDLDKYNYHKRDVWRKEINDQYHLADFKIVYGFVGRVVVEKGINELLEAFMAMDKPDACLVIVGPLNDVGRLNQEIYQKSLLQSNIVFIGSVPNAAKYYAAFDFLMLPSYQEGFGMTILEAAGVGTPSIITNIKGPTELIQDRINGLICEVKSVESLKSVMQKAYDMTEEEYQKMAEKAYEIAVRDFDSEQFKNKFLENRTSLLNQINQ